MPKRVRNWLKVVLAVAGIATVAAGIALAMLADGHPRMEDVTLRHSEICCSHTGINPFRVFQREVSHPGFYGRFRPDMPDETDTAGRREVHAYPPWHTAWFWFYGWMSAKGAATFILCVDVFALFALFFYARRFAPPGALHGRLAFWALVFVPLGFSLMSLAECGNYALLLALATLGMFRALDRNDWKGDILAGLCWALIMIKPQVGTLYFWPLLFAKRYRAIAVAVAATLLATLWPAWVYGESPLQLILEVPAIGAPYVAGGGVGFCKVFVYLLGPTAATWSMSAGFAVCAILSFLLKDADEWSVRFAAVWAIFPIWTYSFEHDWVVAVFLAIAALGYVYGTLGRSERILSCRHAKILKTSLAVYAAASYVMLVRLMVMYAKGWTEANNIPHRVGMVLRTATTLAMLAAIVAIEKSGAKSTKRA